MCQALNFSTVGTVVGAQDTTKNKRSISLKACILVEGRDNTHNIEVNYILK